MSHQPATKQDLLVFLRARCPQVSAIGVDTELVESGIIDSLLMMDLILHLESGHGVTLQTADLAPRHFRTVGALCDLIASKQVSARAA